jgi:hypothetical protein
MGKKEEVKEKRKKEKEKKQVGPTYCHQSTNRGRLKVHLAP